MILLGVFEEHISYAYPWTVFLKHLFFEHVKLAVAAAQNK